MVGWVFRQPSYTTQEHAAPMTFKKGDRVRTDEGLIGEILFIDRDGVEAQVALQRLSIKLRTDSLEKVSPGSGPVEPAVKPKPVRKRATKATKATKAK